MTYMMFENIKKFSMYQIIFSAFSLVGATFAHTVFSMFNFGSIDAAVFETIDWCFDLMFNSLNFLGFFIRPSTVRIVVEIFTSYWLLRLTFKTMIVFSRLAKFLYGIVSNVLGKLTAGILAIFGI